MVTQGLRDARTAQRNGFTAVRRRNSRSPRRQVHLPQESLVTRVIGQILEQMLADNFDEGSVLHAGRQLGNTQVAPQPCPGAEAPDSGFGAISARYGTSSVVHLRSSSRISPDGFQSAFSHNAHDRDS